VRIAEEIRRPCAPDLFYRNKTIPSCAPRSQRCTLAFVYGDEIPRISVIVPAFNAEPWLELCLRALERQKFLRRHEIIVVDNNSSDRSAEIATGHKDVTLLREKRQSSYAARNRGASAARAPILAFLDADCAPDPNWLLTIDEAMQDPRVDVVIGSREFGRDCRSLRLIADYENCRDRRVFSGRRFDTYYGYAGNMAVRTAAFRQHGPFLTVARGGDSLFVQKVVSPNECGAVIWREDMLVRLLNVRSFRTYAHKMFVYASARQSTQGFQAPRSLTFRDRLAAYHTVAAMYPLREKCFLGGFLAAGYMAWMLGRWYNKSLAAMHLA